MGKNLAMKILEAHLVEGQLKYGNQQRVKRTTNAITIELKSTTSSGNRENRKSSVSCAQFFECIVALSHRLPWLDFAHIRYQSQRLGP